MRPLAEVLSSIDVAAEDYEPHGRHVAKLTLAAVERASRARRGRLVLVTGITPTRYGEGKTTTAIGLSMALSRQARAVAALREPSLGPVFGIKGGATGGGKSEVHPKHEINLHFTGDIHAVGAAHNLLATLVDAHLHHGNALGLDPTRIAWPRCLDMNDRALREVVVGLGGPANGPAREAQFVITAASEVMAILCLARDREDLKRRLGAIVVGYKRDDRPVRASDLGAAGATAVLLQRAIAPNVVQTTEGTPAIIHGGPFGNIAHGTSSVLATQAGLGMADWVVQEAGFGADLGCEKFFHIACPAGGFAPAAVVIVATIRALKHHGGADSGDALERGLANLERHVQIVRAFGHDPIVAVNRFDDDREEEVRWLTDALASRGVAACEARPFQDGGDGCEALARLVAERARETPLAPLYDVKEPVRAKIEAIAEAVYGAGSVEYDYKALKSIDRLGAMGLAERPICIAKTPLSLSDDPRKLGAPRGFEFTVRDVMPSAGAGFNVVLAGDVVRMPGLGAKPAAVAMDVDAEGRIQGLY